MSLPPSAERRYSQSWLELNRRLQRIEAEDGLPAAFGALWAHQHERGFIKDDLRSMRRYRFTHPEEPTRFFLGQYNPARALRFTGAGASLPPDGVEVVNDGCFLCRDNIWWQQQGVEIGYEIDVGSSRYIAWVNPFPLMPAAFVIASEDHVPQGWNANGAAPRGPGIESIVRDLASLSERLPGYLGFHNGVGAGASIPSHLHFHFFERPAAQDAFPLEAAAQRSAGSPDTIEDYPVAAHRWRGDAASVGAAAADWIGGWTRQHESMATSISANVVSSCDVEHGLALFFVPRRKDRTHSPELSGAIGGLEVLGELTFSTEEEGRRLERGEVDYHVVERILAAARFE